MTDRIRCLVPGCRRTHPAGRFREWVCSRHWPLVPKVRRRVYSRLNARARRLHEAAEGRAMTEAEATEWWRLQAVLDRLWARLKSQVLAEVRGDFLDGLGGG